MRLLSKIIPMALFLIFFVVACQIGGGNTTTAYYKGFNGVVMTVPAGSIPSKLYYYPDRVLPEDPYEYSLDINIENKGASDTFGGVYISGFDPHLIEFKGMTLDKVDDKRFNCDVDFATIVSKFASGTLSCDIQGFGDIFFGNDPNGWRAGGQNINVGTILGKIFDTNYFVNNSIYGDIVYDSNSGKVQFGIDADIEGINAGYYNHGRMAIAYFTSLHQMKIGRLFIDERKGRLFKYPHGLMIGNRPEYPGGDLDYMSFAYKIQNWPRGLDTADQTLLITSCYVYTTYAAPMICVDPYPESPGRKVCKPKTITYSGGQGAPIAITKIEQENTPQDIFFTIYFENKGKGLVFDPNQLEKCNPWYMEQRVTQRDYNNIYIGQIRVEGDPSPIECTPASRQIRLNNGKGQITCRYPITYKSTTAYQTPLAIEAWYGYSESIQKTLRIKRG